MNNLLNLAIFAVSAVMVYAGIGGLESSYDFIIGSEYMAVYEAADVAADSDFRRGFLTSLFFAPGFIFAAISGKALLTQAAN